MVSTPGPLTQSGGRNGQIRLPVLRWCRASDFQNGNRGEHLADHLVPPQLHKGTNPKAAPPVSGASCSTRPPQPATEERPHRQVPAKPSPRPRQMGAASSHQRPCRALQAAIRPACCQVKRCARARLVLQRTMTGVGFGFGARTGRLAIGAARPHRGTAG